MRGCVRDLISRFRIYFVFAGFFSLVINALLLVPPIYMLQVFDRVLTSRSEETLVYLTVGGFSALVVMARATSNSGETQVNQLIHNPAGYHHNVIQRLYVEVL